MLSELFHAGSYKRNQGRTVRLATAVTIGVIFALLSWRLHETLSTSVRLSGMQLVAPIALLVLGWWFCFRLINYPRFADFLIAVEAEMSKVSWPTQTELIRSSVVVIFFILSLAAILFCFDLFWQYVFGLLGILN
jgi:preprotein translocase subunit SecE